MSTSARDTTCSVSGVAGLESVTRTVRVAGGSSTRGGCWRRRLLPLLTALLPPAWSSPRGGGSPAASSISLCTCSSIAYSCTSCRNTSCSSSPLCALFPSSRSSVSREAGAPCCPPACCGRLDLNRGRRCVHRRFPGGGTYCTCEGRRSSETATRLVPSPGTPPHGQHRQL